MGRMLDGLERWILKNWIPLIIGCILQKSAIEFAFVERGCIAAGGEWFVIPLVVLLWNFIPDLIRTIWSVFHES